MAEDAEAARVDSGASPAGLSTECPPAWGPSTSFRPLSWLDDDADGGESSEDEPVVEGDELAQYVFVEFPPDFRANPAQLSYTFKDLETDRPTVTLLDGTAFFGRWEKSVGTLLVFSEEERAGRGAGADAQQGAAASSSGGAAGQGGGQGTPQQGPQQQGGQQQGQGRGAGGGGAAAVAAGAKTGPKSIGLAAKTSQRLILTRAGPGALR